MHTAQAAGMCDYAAMPDARTRTRLLIEGYLTETGLDPSTLARLAGLAPSTITRFLNSPEFTSIPTTRTLAKLERAVSLWREALSQPDTLPQSPVAEQVGRLVQDPEQLAWLRIWDEMGRADRKRAVSVLRALASDASKFG